MKVTLQDRMALIRAVGLVGRYGTMLAIFEVDLLKTCIERYRDEGDRMTLTDNERRVVTDAVAAMDRAKAAAELDQSNAELAGAMRGTA